MDGDVTAARALERRDFMRCRSFDLRCRVLAGAYGDLTFAQDRVRITEDTTAMLAKILQLRSCVSRQATSHRRRERACKTA